MRRSAAMSEELIQRDLVNAPEQIGLWGYYSIGSTSLKALKAAKIIPDQDYSEFENKKPDALIVGKPNVIAVIEYKQPKELRTKKQIDAAIKQELCTAKALFSKIYIVTDSIKTFWINPLTGNEILDESGTALRVVFDKNDSAIVTLINKIISSISSTNDQIQSSVMVDPLPLAERVWQDLWSVSGATPENCLYTFVEIFIFKYLSDLGVLKGMYSFSDLLERYSGNNENEILEFYASTVRKKIKDLFPRNIDDNTTIINGTIFVSKDDKAVSGYGTVFKKILERFKSFGSLEYIDHDFKSKLFETFLKESISRKNWGQFFTPIKVVRAVVRMADIVAGMKICDPACGVGKFLLEPILDNLPKYYEIQNNTLKHNIELHGFDKGFDKDEQKTIILAKANMLIYMSGLIKEHPDLTTQFSSLFNETFLLQTNSILGTLARPAREEYDLILTNPPYVMSGSSNLKEEISKVDDLKKYYAVNAMGIEGLFIEWIVRALKPGAKAFVIVPDGIMNRGNDKKLREFILDECLIDAIISLPLNTFFTTNKKTYILAITKKCQFVQNGIKVKETQTSPVFTYLCSEIGETRDVYRFDIEQNDLEQAVNLFNMFKGAKDAFSTRDTRCKLFNIDIFYENSHWSIDRWWTNEEKIELGIEDEKNSVDLEGFITLINDIADTIAEYDEPLRELEKKKNPLNNKRLVSLSDKKIFELSIGKRLLRKDFVKDQGDIPMYSANVFEPFVYSNTSNLSDFSMPHVLWGIDGNFEFNPIPQGTQFGTTDHCGAIRIIHPKLNPIYVAFALEQVKEKYGFDRGLRASLSNMRQIEIPIPIDADGDFDSETQQSIANAIECVQQLRSAISIKRNYLEKVYITISHESYELRSFKLLDVFSIIKGKSKYTKKFGDQNKGAFPVYSASSKKPLTYINSYDYDGRFLTWATNGFAGTITIIDEKFSINGDRGILLPHRDFELKINFDYVKFILEPVFRSLAKGRKGDRGEDEFTKLYPSMFSDVHIAFPVSKNGDIDIEAQKEIANKYMEIEQVRSSILDNIDILLSKPIDY